MSRADYARQWYHANPERVTASRAKRAERQRETARLRYAADPEAHRARRRARYHAHPERAKAEADAWRLANRERANNRHVARQARLAGAEGSHTVEEWVARCEAFGNRCAYCGADRPLEQDHFVPLTRGGSDYIANIIPACKPCNSSKGDRDPDVWLVRRGIDVLAFAPYREVTVGVQTSA